MRKWKVQIPNGRWMGGEVLRFFTKHQAQEFIGAWNTIEVNVGRNFLTFYQEKPYSFMSVPQHS